MGLFEKIKNFFASAKTKIAKFMVSHKTLVKAVIEYMALAYDKFDGKQKMEQAVKLFLLWIKQEKLANEYSDDIAEYIEKHIQEVYDEMKAKGLV